MQHTTPTINVKALANKALLSPPFVFFTAIKPQIYGKTASIIITYQTVRFKQKYSPDGATIVLPISSQYAKVAMQHQLRSTKTLISL